MRGFLCLLCLLAGPALAEDSTTSGMIAARGLGATQQHLQDSPADPSRDMALGAVTFLRGLEDAWQARWRIGATDPLIPAPILGTALPANPAPEPMRASFVNDLSRDLRQAMQDTRAALQSDDPDAALILRLDDLWLDVDADGRRGPSESLTALAGFPSAGEGTTIRFDHADIAWLRAYTHLIEAMTTLTLAFDPQPALQRTIDLQAEISRQFAEPPGQMARAPNMQMQARAFGPTTDRLAVVIQTLRQQPDPDLIADTDAQLRQMIAENRLFWDRVGQEQDNDREWIPNDAQQAALGFDLPQGTGPAWLAVLDAAQDMLDGRQLIPFWRLAPGHGIDLSLWIKDPQPVDLVGWVQGSAALPYMRQGLTLGGDVFENVTQMFGARTGLYMVLLN